MTMVQLCDIELILKPTQYFKFTTSIFDKGQNKLIPRQENTIPNRYWSILLSSAISNSRMFTRLVHFKTDFTKNICLPIQYYWFIA